MTGLLLRLVLCDSIDLHSDQRVDNGALLLVHLWELLPTYHLMNTHTHYMDIINSNLIAELTHTVNVASFQLWPFVYEHMNRVRGCLIVFEPGWTDGVVCSPDAPRASLG